MNRGLKWFTGFLGVMLAISSIAYAEDPPSNEPSGSVSGHKWSLKCERLLGQNDFEFRDYISFDRLELAERPARRLLKAVDRKYQRERSEEMIDTVNLYFHFLRATGYAGMRLIHPNFVKEVLEKWPNDSRAEILKTILEKATVTAQRRSYYFSERTGETVLYKRYGRMWLRLVREMGVQEDIYFVRGGIYYSLPLPSDLQLTSEERGLLSGGDHSLLTEAGVGALIRVYRGLPKEKSGELSSLVRFAIRGIDPSDSKTYLNRDTLWAYIHFTYQSLRRNRQAPYIDPTYLGLTMDLASEKQRRGIFLVLERALDHLKSPGATPEQALSEAHAEIVQRTGLENTPSLTLQSR